MMRPATSEVMRRLMRLIVTNPALDEALKAQAHGRDGLQHQGQVLRGAGVGGGRKLSLGQAVDAIVLNDIGHPNAPSHGIGKLTQADRG